MGNKHYQKWFRLEPVLGSNRACEELGNCRSILTSGKLNRLKSTALLGFVSEVARQAAAPEIGETGEVRDS